MKSEIVILNSFQDPKKMPKQVRHDIWKNQRGQTLIELLVALIIGILIITGFVTLGITSLRNSGISSDQVTATKYGQEAIEAMITIRDQNSPCNGPTCAIQSFDVNQWCKLFIDACDGSMTTGMACTNPADLTSLCANDFVLLTSTCSLGSPATDQRCVQRNLTFWDATPSNPWQISGTKFFRKVRITDAAGVTNVKDITVFVWWTDTVGLHKSILTRRLSRDKL